MNAGPNSAKVTLRSLWWLNPAILFAIVTLVTIHWAISMSPEGYRLYDCPKYIDASYYPLAVLGVLGMATGYLFSARGGAEEAPDNLEEHRELLLRVFWVCTALCIFSYSVWFLVGVKNGFRPGMILHFLTGRDDKLGTFELKERIFTTVPGITTLSQCAVAAVCLGIMPPVWKTRWVKTVLAGLFTLGFLRAMLISERLALIELTLMAFLVSLRLFVLRRSFDPRLILGMRIAPVLGPIMLLVLFGSFEYFRSYQFYKNRFNNIAEFTIWRVSAYYTTGHNNGALIHKEWGQWPLPFQSITAVWSFPLVKYSPLSYQKLTGIDPDKKYDDLLRLKAVEEYNNDSGFLGPHNDFGVVGFAVFWSVFGYLSGMAHRAYLKGNITGICFYPLFFLTVLETPRFIYITLSRTTPPLIVFACLWYWLMVAHRMKTRKLAATDDQNLLLIGPSTNSD